MSNVTPNETCKNPVHASIRSYSIELIEPTIKNRAIALVRYMNFIVVYTLSICYKAVRGFRLLIHPLAYRPIYPPHDVQFRCRTHKSLLHLAIDIFSNTRCHILLYKFHQVVFYEEHRPLDDKHRYPT